MQSIFGGGGGGGQNRNVYRPDINEPFVPPSLQAFSRPVRVNERERAAPSGNIFGQSPLSSLIGAPLGAPDQHQRPQDSKPEAGVAQLSPSRSSIANIMRRFDKIVNEESDASNIDGADNQNEAIYRAPSCEFSRMLERSLAQGGRAGISDANFLSGQLRLGSVLDRPIFEPVASDSGQDEIDALGDFDLAAIQQEMLDAGYTQSEIRASLQNRLERQNKQQVADNEESSSNSALSQSNELLVKSSSGQQPDFEMSQVSSVSNDSWGGNSEIQSPLHHFQQKSNLTVMERQSLRFVSLKTVLYDQRELVESILAQVYTDLDKFKNQGSQDSVSMEVDSGLLIHKQSSSNIYPFLPKANDCQSEIEFHNEAIHQRFLHKEGTFKVQISDRTTKNYVQENMHRRHCISTTDQGLVCLLQDDQVVFYASNSLLDPSILQNASEKSQLFKALQKRASGNQSGVTSLSTFKPTFVPVAAKFNSSYESYCAVWGISDLTVLTLCPKEGKVKSNLTVNLMLAAFGEHLSILDVKWVPSARSILAVASQIFVRVYDLSKDNFSPLFNIQLTSGSITDFTFTEPIYGSCAETGHIQTRILVSSQSDSSDAASGHLFHQELNMVIEDGDVSANKGSVKMQVDEITQNSEVFMTQEILIPSQSDSTNANYKIANQKGCIPAIVSISYLPTHSLLALSFKNGQTMIGKLDQRTYELSHCLVVPDINILKHSNSQQLAQNGKYYSDFQELTFVDGQNANQKQSLYLLANFSKQAAAVPCVLEITKNQIKVNIVHGKQANLQNKLSPCHGFSLVNPSFVKAWRKAPRLMIFDESGQAIIFKIQKRDSQSEERKDSSLMKEMGAYRRIIKSDLPKKVIMPANFFEKQKNISQDQSLYKQMSVTGSFAKMLKSRIHRLFDVKYDESGFADDKESETKINLSLNAHKTQHAIIGLRVRVGSSRRQGEIKMRLMEREPIIVPHGDSYWYDLALSDVEVIYGSQNQIELTISTTNVKACPVRLFKVEVFVSSIIDFQLVEKQSRHMRELYKQNQAEKNDTKVGSIQSTIEQELLQTNHLPYVNWFEKYNTNQNMASLELSAVQQLEIKLSILQQFLLSNVSSNPNQSSQQQPEALNPELINTLETLRAKLVDAYRLIIQQQIEHGSLKNHSSADSPSEDKHKGNKTEIHLHASIKRILKIVLSMLKRDTQLGEPLNFKTLKDKLVIEAICDRYQTEEKADSQMNVADLPFDLIKKHLKCLGNIRQKRSQQYFRLIESRRDLVQKITHAYIKIAQNEKQQGLSESNDQYEARDLVNLIFADFQMQVNSQTAIKQGIKGAEIKQLIETIMQDTSLSESLEPLAKLLLIKNERVAKQVIKAIQRCMLQFQVIMARSYKSNQIIRFKYYNETSNQVEETQVILIDVIPHLLHKLLINTIPKFRERAQLAFKLAIGALQSYAQQSAILGLPVKFVFQPIKQFVKRVMCETQVIEPSYQFVFACLTLLNSLLTTEAQKEVFLPSLLPKSAGNDSLKTPNNAGWLFGAPETVSNIDGEVEKQKSIQISPFSNDQRRYFVEYMTEGDEFGEKLLNWLSQALEQLNAAYQAGRCSIRVNVENQVKTGAIDHINDSSFGSGVNLLRPLVNHQTLWRWTPLLPESDEIFELLDRKIPASILVLCQLVAEDFKFQNYTTAFKKLLRAIVQMSHTLPSSHIFSALGQRTLQSLAPSQATIFKNQTLLREFLTDLKQICQLHLGINLQIDSQSNAASDKNEADKGQQNFVKEMSYNLQFQFQKILQNGVRLALETPNDWRELIDESGGRADIIGLLVKLLDHVNNQSAILCLTLATISLEAPKASKKFSLANSMHYFNQQAGLDGLSLFHFIQALLKDEKQSMTPSFRDNLQNDQSNIKKDGRSVMHWQNYSDQSSSGQANQSHLKSKNESESAAEMEIDEITNQAQHIKLDLSKLVDIFLIGKSDRKMRIQTAQLIKALYDARAVTFEELLPIFARKFTTLASAGVNSAEFLCIFGYLCQKELASDSNSMSFEQISQIVSFIAQQIQICNQQLTSHPNLELYATIQKICNQNNSASKRGYNGPPGLLKPGTSNDFNSLSMIMGDLGKIEDHQLIKNMNNRGAGFPGGPPPSFDSYKEARLHGNPQFSTQQQVYILELDPCSKCFQTMEKSYRHANLKDIQSESKFTDKTSIFRLKNAFELKSFNYNVHEAKGYKTIRKISLYVNSIQDVDLAEMKNNWQLWQKVCDLNVDVSQKSQFSVTLPLPVTATNILIQYQAVNLSKPVEFSNRNKGCGPPKYFGSGYANSDSNRAKEVEGEVDSTALEGLDSVLQLLPREVTNKLNLALIKQNQVQCNQDGEGALQPNISISCPRCGAHVNNSHGNCNNCGENAMQCPACRNINYERIDPFQCKECGISRYCKGEIGFNLREGVAVQLVETEDAKKLAEEQVEQNLQKAQSSYQALMKQRQTIHQIVCQINEGSDNASPKLLQQLYTGDCQSQYSTMMKALSGIKQLRIEIIKFQKAARSLSVGAPTTSLKKSDNEISMILSDSLEADKIQQNCFGCIQEYMQALLNFIQLTAGFSKQLRSHFTQKAMTMQLYKESLRMFSQNIYLPARQAICALVRDNEAELDLLLEHIESDLRSRHNLIPAHLLFQNLHQEAQLLIDLVDLFSERKQGSQPADQHALKKVKAAFWRVLFQSLQDARNSSAVAEAVTAPLLQKIDKIITQELSQSQQSRKEDSDAKKEEDEKAQPESKPTILISTQVLVPGSTTQNQQQKEFKGESEMLQLLIDYLKAADQSNYTFVEGEATTKSSDGQWLVQSLLLSSSQSARQHSVAIIRKLLSEKELHLQITEMLLESLDESLGTAPLSSEEYFNLLTQLLTGQGADQKQLQIPAGSAGEPPKALKLNVGGPPPSGRLLTGSTDATDRKPNAPKQLQAQEKQQVHHNELTEEMRQHFRKVFDRVDGELDKLFVLELEKKQLGPDGFMPQLSAGHSLSRLVKIIALMMNDQPGLTAIVQQQVRVVLKTLLKLKKLTLVKNKQLANCEEQINGIFKKLHSDNDADKQNFIKECLGLIASGDCDLQEARYLFEDICKMIVPAKIEHEYFLHLQKARSNEEFIPGKIAKNPHSSKSFGGKTMADVRLKICRDCDIGEPEMLELLIAGKIVTMNLPINAVYEQVWWPSQYKAKHPDSYEVPPIEQGMKDDPSLINSMVVIFRLAGMDGEATEDRVESLQTDQEPSSEKELQSKYGLASVIAEKLGAGQMTGVAVLLQTLAAIGQVQENKDLASWLVQLMNISIKLKQNRLEFLRHPKAIAIIAKKLFQSVGMHSKFDGKNEQSLFDLILNILEVLINEQMNNVTSTPHTQSEVAADKTQIITYQIDTGASNINEAQSQNKDEESEAVTHVQIFLSLIADACKEMIEEMKPLDQASQKIKAVSKVLPQLIGEKDKEALAILIQLVQEHITVEKVHVNLPPSQNASISTDSFSCRFYIERIIDIIESIPAHKNFIKDSLCEIPQLSAILEYMISESAQFQEPTIDCAQDLTQNVLMLRIVKAMVQNHPKSQQLLVRFNLIEKLYTLSLQKFKPMQLVLLAEDCVKLLTNEVANAEVRSGLLKIIDKKKQEQTVRAKKAKLAAQKRLQKKGAANKFLSMVKNVQEEKGPKCVSCEDGYMAKPSEIMGVYVFSKRLPFREWSGTSNLSQSQSQASPVSQGYTTVTHSNYIHYVCHQEVARVDRERQQPIREWDGAKTRNHHTLCNNLFPVLGGKFPIESYSSIIDKYFATQAKQVGGADSNRLKVLSHDLKSLLRRFACNESFSRDSKGGGPEHNMQFIPFMTSVIIHSLTSSSSSCQQNLLKPGGAAADEPKFTYVQEKKLAEFLQLCTQKRQTFLARLAEEEEGEEEEKRSDQSEEDKRMEEEEEEGEEESLESRSDDFAQQLRNPALLVRIGEKPPEEDPRIDQVLYFISQSLLFARMGTWETTKINLLTCALCAVAATRQQTQAQTQKLRMMEDQAGSDAADDQPMASEGRGRARSLSNVSNALQENLTEILGRLKPFFVMLSLVDLIKTTWNERVPDDLSQPIQAYHDNLMRNYLTKENLVPVIEDCNLFFKMFDERMTRIESVEGFLNLLRLKERITTDFTTIEKFVYSHFSTDTESNAMPMCQKFSKSKS